MIKSPSHIFVDLDGTLVDSIGCLYDAYCNFLSAYGIKGTKEEFDTFNGPSILEVTKTLKDKYELPKVVEELYKQYIEIIKESFSNIKAFKDSKIFLLLLHKAGIKLTLVTSSDSITGGAIVKKFQWEKYFSNFVWGDDVQRSKPHPYIYIKALAQANADKNDVVIIEDSVNGVKSGVGAGITVFGLANNDDGNLINAGATEVFKSLSSILDYILRK